MTPQDIEAAKQLILDAMGPPKQPVQGAPGQPGTGMVMPWQEQMLLMSAAKQPQLTDGASKPNEDWEAMPRVTKRPDEMGG